MAISTKRKIKQKKKQVKYTHTCIYTYIHIYIYIYTHIYVCVYVIYEVAKYCKADNKSQFKSTREFESGLWPKQLSCYKNLQS